MGWRWSVNSAAHCDLSTTVGLIFRSLDQMAEKGKSNISWGDSWFTRGWEPVPIAATLVSFHMGVSPMTLHIIIKHHCHVRQGHHSCSYLDVSSGSVSVFVADWLFKGVQPDSMLPECYPVYLRPTLIEHGFTVRLYYTLTHIWNVHEVGRCVW